MSSNLLRHGAVAALASLAIIDPAIAGLAPVPGPMIGAGLPALALFGVGYWLIRRRRRA